MTHPVQPKLPTPISPWVWSSLAVLAAAAGFALFLRNQATPVPPSWGVDAGPRLGLAQFLNAFQSLLIPGVISFSAAVILTRRPAHPIGRLLMLLSLSSALGFFTQEWAVFGYYTLQAPLFGASLAAWVANWIWVIIFTSLLLTAAIFPDGQFLSRRWAWLTGFHLTMFAAPLLLGAAVETPMTSVFLIANPYVAVHPADFYNLAFPIGVTFMPLTALVVLVSAFARFRSSRGPQRQQMKWLFYGVVVMVVLTIAGLGINFILGSSLGGILVNAALLGPALGVVVALLRHRLYDIDILIRRTLQYSLLTGTLALIYFALVTLLQSLFTGFSNQQSPYVVVLSTLAIAALFNPLRRRVQKFIDQRFYRQKYNTEQTLHRFSAAARSEVALEQLESTLVAVVSETMQPEAVSLWLAQTEKPVRSKRG